MELKMTERDKILLILLVIMLIIFALVMIPNYGIMASINTITDGKDKIAEQQAINKQELDDLIKSGVSSRYADNASGAVRDLQERIVNAEYDAVKESSLSLSAVSTSVARDWLLPVAYYNYENGTDADKLYDNIQVTNNTSGYVSQNFAIDAMQYSSKVYSCELSGESTIENFNYQVTYADQNMASIYQMITAHNLLVERGSVQIADGPSVWTVDDNGQMRWSLRLIIPANSKIDQYKMELGECHNCGAHYSLDGFDPDNPAHCEECDEVLTGESLR